MENIIYTIPLDEFTDIIKKCIREEMSSSQPQKKDEELIKIADAVKLLGVSKVTIYKWREKGILPYHRISSRIYFKKHELLEALKMSPRYKSNKN
jgi:excisionase family DNA binding protein